MKPLNNKSYKEALKSVVPKFDEGMIWDGIEDRLDKKKKKRFFVWLWSGCFGIILAFFILLVPNYENSEDLNFGLDVETQQSENVEMLNSLDGEPTKVDKLSESEISSSNNGQVKKSALVKSAKQNTIDGEQAKVDASVLRKIFPELNRQNNKTLSKKSTKQNPQTKIENSSSEYKYVDTEINLISTTKYVNYVIEAYPQKNTVLEQSPNLEILKISELAISQRDMAYVDIELSSQSYLEKSSLKPLKQRFLFAAVVGSPNSKYADNDGLSQSWADKSQEASTDLYSVGLRGSYNFEVATNFSVSLGLAMSRVSERFNRTFENIETSIIEKDSAIFIVNAQGVQQFYQGSQVQTITSETRVQQYNHFYNIGLSLGAMYENSIKNKLSAYIEGLVIYSPLQIVTGKSLDVNDELVDLSMNAANQLLQLSAGTGVTYRHNESYSYQFGIQWTSDITNRYLHSQLGLKKKEWGLKLGVLYTIQ